MFRAMALEGVLVEMGRLENAMKKRYIKKALSFLGEVSRVFIWN